MNTQATKGEILRTCSLSSFLFHFFKLQNSTFRRGESWRSIFSRKNKKREEEGLGVEVICAFLVI